MDSFSIQSSEDGLKGYVYIPQKYKFAYPDIDTLKRYLEEQGIVHGIKIDVLKNMVDQRVCDSKICIAEGKPPHPGVVGKLEILFDVSKIGRPKTFKDGSVDHKDLKKIINVHKGESLIKRIPASPSIPGYSIYGKKIKVSIPKEADLKPGLGTEISQSDKDLLVASIDGAVFINQEGLIEVKNSKIIQGDIDYATGNISFSGDLKILGTVRAGFAVKANGNLCIQGNIEDSQVISFGNMEITGGAVGSKTSKIICGGIVKIHHVENFSIKAEKKIIVSDTVLHSTIKTDDFFKASKIVGGTIESSYGIDAEIIGTSAETKTTIQIGSNFLLIQQQQALQDKILEIQTTGNELNEKIYLIVKNGMNEKGQLIHDELIRFKDVKAAKAKLDIHCDILKNKIEEIIERINHCPDPFINARCIFPNTIVRFGLLEKTIHEKLEDVCIHAVDTKIIIDKLK